MTAFEQGYAAFLKGMSVDQNPYQKESTPYSHMRWIEGWKAARAHRIEVAR